MDYNNYNGNEQRYNFTVTRPAEAASLPPAPVRRKKRTFAVAAIILAGFVLAGTAGGLTGYFLADKGDPPSQSSQQSQPSVSPDPAPFQPVSTDASDDVADSLTPAQIYELCNSAVVAIDNYAAGGGFRGGSSTVLQGSGSGFFISEDGFIVTNHHVISGASKIEVIMHDGTKLTARLVGSDAEADIALLKVDGTGYDYLSFGSSAEARVGDPVVAIGNPLGELANTLTVGYISGLDRTVTVEDVKMVLMQTDAAVSPGNSGGPLIDGYGKVVGVINAKSTSTYAEGLGFAIPADTAAKVVADLTEHGFVRGRPYLGITAETVSESRANDEGLVPGVMVREVTGGSCAQKAGIVAGDIITELDGDKITDLNSLLASRDRHQAGDTVRVTVWREGREYVLTLTFDEQV
ncbi:MAG: trypsin-like peptidase domain-containing protein [Oscillospiraceae bacterium]|jgi:serine protease Do|nr:trypsin-like peptidase domain-containing protein [Oscillospiraceae bacterium]